MLSVTQDAVHLGVKLKARLMKPGIILPMGTYLASASNLKLIFAHIGKEVRKNERYRP